MARTWEHVYSYDWAEEDTESLIVEYRPGGTVTFIAHNPDLLTGGTVELVGMPWEEFTAMFDSMFRYYANDTERPLAPYEPLADEPWPPGYGWMVTLWDDDRGRWLPGSMHQTREQAEERRTYWQERWPDRQCRIVRETRTYTTEKE